MVCIHLESSVYNHCSLVWSLHSYNIQMDEISSMFVVNIVVDGTFSIEKH